jgi:hypothetical protein
MKNAALGEPNAAFCCCKWRLRKRALERVRHVGREAIFFYVRAAERPTIGQADAQLVGDAAAYT